MPFYKFPLVDLSPPTHNDNISVCVICDTWLTVWPLTLSRQIPKGSFTPDPLSYALHCTVATRGWISIVFRNFASNLHFAVSHCSLYWGLPPNSIFLCCSWYFFGHGWKALTTTSSFASNGVTHCHAPDLVWKNLFPLARLSETSPGFSGVRCSLVGRS